MAVPVSLTVNGQPQQVEVDSRLLLVHFLRDVLGLTGTKVACDTSQCGACTVLVDGVAVKSCVAQADGTASPRSGLAAPARCIDSGSVLEQTASSAVSARPAGVCHAHELLRQNPIPPEEIRHRLDGLTCALCTAYPSCGRARRPGPPGAK
jgi:carbon-monoxide dehydrogenase small subunit